MSTSRRSAEPRTKGEVHSHRDLLAWKRSYELGLAIYRATASFPADERFVLVSQLRRAGISVASNIAEGRARGSHKEFIRFLRIALGGLAEIDTQVRFAADLDYLTPGQFAPLALGVDECSRLIQSLIGAVARSQAATKRPLPTRRSPAPDT